ncbi:hypothetical protein M514_08632 [Trichuris suis]|uniref:DDE-1 domain-containing protein n=1 Tax=Trichuris suis TaxID=68888 RepID=A0A085N3J9_9BILA|nr:hypothetical protein M514_08632 [Trichuris suis]
MTTEITSGWFERHFIPEARAHCNSIGLDKDCKIVLTLDNCPAHPVTELVKKNVHSVRLPPNCTSLIQPLDNGILRSLKCNYCSMCMTRLLSASNSGMPVQEFLKGFNLRNMIYCLANAWNSVESTLRNGWYKLWPGLRGERTDQEDINDATGIMVSEKKSIRELLKFAQNLTNPSATDLASRVAEDNLEEWMEADNALATHHCTDSEIVQMIVSQNKEGNQGESCGETEKAA